VNYFFCHPGLDPGSRHSTDLKTSFEKALLDSRFRGNDKEKLFISTHGFQDIV